MTAIRPFLGLWGALLALALPPTCAGCRREGPALCVHCRVALQWVAATDAGRVWPDPLPAGLPPTWATARLEGPLRVALTAYKDHGRRDLVPFLAPLLARAVTAARADEPTVLIPVPGSARSRRVRGDLPLEALVLAAAARLPGEVRVVRALRTVRSVADQAGLDHAQRRTNVANSFRAAPGVAEAVGASTVILVDDIVTTGATLVEGARALGVAGIRARGACIAATVRQAGHQRGMTGGWAEGVVGGTEAD